MFKDKYVFSKTCENYLKLRSISKRHMMSLNPILVIEIFVCWGIDFIGPFPPSFDFFMHISRSRLCCKIDKCNSKSKHDHKTMIKFLKENILSRFGIPLAMISDGGTYFCNKPFQSLMKKI